MTSAPFHKDISRAPSGEICEYLTCKDGVRIRVAAWKGGTKGTIFIFQGRTEFIEKYGPVVKQFLDRGYSVATLDWRGQGLSDRLNDRPTLGHVRHFDDYQLDVAEFKGFVDKLDLPGPNIMLAHSLGGGVGLRAIQEGFPVEKAIFSAPMWDIAVNSFGNSVIKLFCKIFGTFLFKNSIVPSRSIRNNSFTDSFEGNILTNNKYEFEFRQKQLATHPDVEVGGPSILWVTRALSDTKKIRNSKLPEIPAICFLGLKEKIVSQGAIRTIISKWKNSSLVTFPNAQHELMIETSDVTTKIWSEIDEFLS